jgi:hypothetical protein
VLLPVLGAAAANAADCPRTLGTNIEFREPWPKTPSWYGTEALAVILPPNGAWRTTSRASRIAVKLFWFSTEFQAAAESGFDKREQIGFTVTIRRLDEGPDDAVISGPTWAGNGDLGDNWTQLTGIDFRSAGCWEITGTFLDQSLSFIVETVDQADPGGKS